MTYAERSNARCRTLRKLADAIVWQCQLSRAQAGAETAEDRKVVRVIGLEVLTNDHKIERLADDVAFLEMRATAAEMVEKGQAARERILAGIQTT